MTVGQLKPDEASGLSSSKARVSIIETLIRVVPVVRDLTGTPDPDVLRRALRKKLNQGEHAGELDQDETKAITWPACGTIGKRQGPRFRAFYGCMFYALMRPSEVAALTRESCHLPQTGWGYLIFADSSPAPGKAYTDDGQVHEHRGLKGRTRGRPSPRARRPVRKVPIPPELV